MTNPNEEDAAFDPSTLQRYTKAAEKLHHDILFGTDVNGSGADPLAEQEYLVALSHLELAMRHFTMARTHQVRALAAANGRRYP